MSTCIINWRRSLRDCLKWNQRVRIQVWTIHLNQKTKQKVQYIIVDLWRLNRYQVAFKSDRQRLEKIIPQIEKLYNSGEYGITDFRDGVILLKKAVSSNLDAVAAWQEFRQKIAQFSD